MCYLVAKDQALGSDPIKYFHSFKGMLEKGIYKADLFSDL